MEITGSGDEAQDTTGMRGASGAGSGAGVAVPTFINRFLLYFAWLVRFRRRLCSSFYRSFDGLISLGFPNGRAS